MYTIGGMASQWTRCYADALLFRAGWISAVCLARLPRPRWPRKPPRFWNLCRSPRTCPARLLAACTCFWSRSLAAGTLISYLWSYPCSCAIGQWLTPRIPKLIYIRYFFLIYGNICFICKSIENCFYKFPKVLASLVQNRTRW